MKGEAPRNFRNFLKFLSKTMYKIYDFLINFTQIFLFSSLPWISPYVYLQPLEVCDAINLNNNDDKVAY